MKEIQDKPQLLDILHTAELPFSPTLDDADHALQYDVVERNLLNAGSQTFTAAIGAMVLCRSILIITAETNTFGMGTIQRFTSVFVPVFITCSLLKTIHVDEDCRNPILARIIQLFVVGTYFGIGFAIPAIFSSSNDLLSTFVCFLSTSRVIYVAVALCRKGLLSRIDKFAPVLTILSVIPWIAAIFINGSRERYISYGVGVIIDSILYAVVLVLDKRFWDTQLSLYENNFLRPCLLATVFMYLFQANQTLSLREAYSTIGFGIYEFFVGIITFLTTYNLHALSIDEFKAISQNSAKTHTIYVAKEFLSALNIGLFICFAGLIQKETGEMYTASKSGFDTPLMIVISTNTTVTVQSPGSSYLSALTSPSFTVSQRQTTSISLILPLVAIFGAAQGCRYLVAASIHGLTKKSRFFTIYIVATTAAIGMVALTPSSWTGYDRDLLLLLVAIYFLFTASIKEYINKFK